MCVTVMIALLFSQVVKALLSFDCAHGDHTRTRRTGMCVFVPLSSLRYRLLRVHFQGAKLSEYIKAAWLLYYHDDE